LRGRHSPRRAAVLFGAPLLVAAAVLAATVGRAAPATAGVPTATSVCGAAAPGFAKCYAQIVPAAEQPFGAQAPSGYAPADLKAAYKLPAAAGAGQTIAIVDAFDDPYAEADLAAYRAHWGLSKCTTRNGCFQKIDQRGGTTYPPFNSNWALEEALDIEMVSAICPKCHIVLVEADDNSEANLYVAEDKAAALGANAISNSWGEDEVAGLNTDGDPHFDHPGSAITVSSGDSGYGVSWPAASKYVTAVGGTTLTKDSSNRGWTETAWSGAGSGCSQYEAKPAWQTDTRCKKRSVADVSAVANPATGVAVLYHGVWYRVGGTSVSSPIIASIYGLAGNGSSVDYGSYPYAHTAKNLYDVKSGSNGSCGGSYLCTAKRGYDGPTGLGSPKKTGGF
jgi:subtilase family serine protease